MIQLNGKKLNILKMIILVNVEFYKTLRIFISGNVKQLKEVM